MTTSSTTTRRTTVVTEVPDERRWQGRDWVKALVAGGLALSLLRPGATTAPVAQPTAAAVATPIPAVVSTAVPTVAATVAPTVAATVGLPAAAAPAIASELADVAAGPFELSGTGSPGSLVEVLVNGVSAGTATVGADGTWSLPITLEAGETELVARAVNEAGTTVAEGEPVELTIGAAGAAGAAEIEIPTFELPAGGLGAGPIELTGTGTPGSTVEVLAGGASLGTATVGDDGTWSLPATLEAGATELVVRALDAAGAVVAEAEPLELTVGEAGAGGAAAGGTPADIAVPTFDAPAGDLPGGPAVLTGTGSPGSTVRVSVGGVDAGTAVVGPDGTWELDAILTAGTQPVVVEAIDANGSTVASAEPAQINVVGGLGVTVGEPAEGAELEPGPVTVSGTGQAGTVLEILDGDRVLGEVTIGADGTWTTEVPLEAGTSAISVREQGSDQILSRPVRVTVGDAPAVAAGCGDELQTGCQAWVTRAGGLQLRIRSAPTIVSDNIITRLPIGTEMTLEEGPQSADGFSWWRVTTEGGAEGWVAGENLVTQPD